MSSDLTAHYGLSKYGRNSSISDDDYKFGVGDRDKLDMLLWLLANHVHDGSSASATDPTDVLTLELDQSAGVLPAGTPVYYVYTLVNEFGAESLPSPEATIVIPPAVSSPSAVTFAIASGGSLLPGSYAYAISAYKDANTLETLAPNVTNVQLLAGDTWQVTLTLPALPSGADGFNIYRRGPGQAQYHYLESIDMTVATPPDEYVDDGTVTEASDRGLPARNTTNAQNSVLASFPGATPVVPEGYTWKLYRTLLTGSYPPASLVHWVVEETSEGSGVITTEYLDLGYATTQGQPPSSSFAFTEPTPVDLTDAAHVQGILPPANIVFRHTEEWAYDGTVTAVAGEFAWLCPFEEAYIIGVILNLGRGFSPATQSLIVDVNKYDSSLATPTWGTIFTTQATRPRILVGESAGALAVPQVRTLVEGDMLTVDVDQAGGGATPTDENLLVQVLMYYKDSTLTTVVFP